MPNTETSRTPHGGSAAHSWARTVTILAVLWSAACGTTSEQLSAPLPTPRKPVAPLAAVDTTLYRVDVTTVTTGAHLDADGYGVLNDEWDYDVGDAVTVDVPTNGTTTLFLRAGGPVMSLVGLASNCTGEDVDDRSVIVSTSAVTTVQFIVVCQ